MRTGWMRRRFSAPLGLLAAVVLLASCADPETHPDAVRTASGEQRYRDGLYSSAFSHPDQEGWRPFLMVEVEAGLITTVCFDAVDQNGSRVREAEGYQETLRLQKGVSLSAVLASYQEQILQSQSRLGVVEPRVLEWAIYLDQLLRDVLAAAEQGPQPGGRTAAQQTPALLPMQSLYVISDDPDALGWQAQLVTVHDQTSVLAAHYAELRRTAERTERKREDPLFELEYEQARGLRFSGVADDLAAAIVGGVADPQGASPSFDTVAGATLSAQRFRSLTERLSRLRSRVTLPRRLCP